MENMYNEPCTGSACNACSSKPQFERDSYFKKTTLSEKNIKNSE